MIQINANFEDNLTFCEKLMIKFRFQVFPNQNKFFLLDLLNPVLITKILKYFLMNANCINCNRDYLNGLLFNPS